MDHNGYHDFLYVWKPKEFKLFEVGINDLKETYIKNTYSILDDSRTTKAAPYLLVLLDQLYNIPEIYEEFEKHNEYYLFCCNYNYYIKDMDISALFPTIRKAYIFFLEVLWKKTFPSDESIKDYISKNKTNYVLYDNLENIKSFSKNHNNIDITCLICETGIENLHQDILNSYQFKIKNFNFYTLIIILINAKMLKDEFFRLHNGKDLLDYNEIKSLKDPKILNLNRRPDIHRYIITQSMLGQYSKNKNRLKISWLGNPDHTISDDTRFDDRAREYILNEFSQRELKHIIEGVDLLKYFKYIIDKDLFSNDGFFRFADTHQHYKNVFLEVVSESIFLGPLGDVSEKSIRPIIKKTPFIIAGGPGSFKLLENLGFKSYDHLTLVKSDNLDTATRMRSILKFTRDLSDLSQEAFCSYSQYFYHKAKPEIKHNFNLFQSDELTENIKKWILTIYQ
jgi:hypothetical protein